MAVQSSGQIKLSEVVTVLGGTTSPKASDYYRGSVYVEDTPQHAGIPTSGEIKLADLYNADAVTFAIAGPTNVNETDIPLTYTVTTTGFSDGTTGTLYWTVDGTVADFVNTSGSFTSTNNTGVFSVDAIEDLALEGDESYTISVRTGSVSGAVRSTASVLIIDDSSISVTYSLTGPTSINEGSAGTFSAALTGIPANTTLYWTVDGTTSDFVAVSGSVLTTGDETAGAATFNVSAKADLTENTVTTPTLTASASVSTLPASITSVTGPASVNEGSAATFTVATTNISDGTTLNWSVATNAGDFSTSSGTFTVNSNAGTFTVTPDADTTTEGAETFTVTVSGGGATSKTSSSVTINDTSLSSLTPTIVSVTGPTSVNEGSNATINVVTSDITDGTTLTWTIASNAGDFTTSTGTFTVNSGAGSFTVTPTADATTEGTETFTVAVSGGGATAVTSSTITINDTSTGGYSGTLDAKWNTSTKTVELIGWADYGSHTLSNGFTISVSGLIDASDPKSVYATTYEDTSGDQTGFTSIVLTNNAGSSVTLTRAGATSVVNSTSGTGQVIWTWDDILNGTQFDADLTQQWIDEGSPTSLAGDDLQDPISIAINY